MADQAGHSVAAIRAAQSALSTRHTAAVDADRALAETLAGAHGVTAAALRRLDEIEAAVESVVAHQDALGLDTPAGARELHRFLIAKQREVATIVADAAAEDGAKRAVLERLSAHYTPSPRSSTT